MCILTLDVTLITLVTRLNI